MFEAERECGRPCPLRLSETGETWHLITPCVREEVIILSFIVHLFIFPLMSLQVVQSGSVPSSQTFFPRLGLQTANWLLSSVLDGRATKTNCLAGWS